MSNDPTLTDEELALWHERGEVQAKENVRRLIAALRASREEVDRLRGLLDDEVQKQYQAEASRDWRAQQ